MKNLAILLLAFYVSAAAGQALPDNPTPAPFPDPAWTRLQSLVNGQPILAHGAAARLGRSSAGITAQPLSAPTGTLRRAIFSFTTWMTVSSWPL